MDTNCKNPVCGKQIKVAIFKSEDFCSVDCRKALGADATSNGTMVLLSPEEQKVIMEYRARPPRDARVDKV